MKSIRQRLFLQIGGIIFLLFALTIIANTLFLEDYYVREQKSSLIRNYELINQISDYDATTALDTFIIIESNSNVDIIIQDTNEAIVYTSNNYLSPSGPLRHSLDQLPILKRPEDAPPGSDEKNEQDNRYNPIRPDPIEIKDTTIINEHVVFYRAIDPITNTPGLGLSGYLDNGYSISLRLPMASIQTSITLVNRFLLIIGGILLVLTLFLTYLLSNYFTKPIRQIHQTTNRLKALDFTVPCLITSKDELGALAININDMSTALEDTISSLNGSNDALQIEIEAKNKLDLKRQQLLNNVSHELKTPLSLMLGYAEGLKLHIANDPEKVDFYCDVIVDETNKMNQLVQHLLDIDQVEFGDFKSHPIKLDLTDYLNNTIKKYQPQFDELGIQLSADLPPSQQIFADPLRLDQVFVNYLSNALHYCNDEKKVRITLTNTGEHIRIEVYNGSEPIDEQIKDRLWDSFYKIDKARTRAVGGHGLGLSIVKAIQMANNNDFGCENKNNGVVFWFEVDLY